MLINCTDSGLQSFFHSRRG